MNFTLRFNSSTVQCLALNPNLYVYANKDFCFS